MNIRRLDPILIDQIAAGEVIERPAAAVKELVENAIDAKATRIDVTLEQGGRRLIRVMDDGVGMGPEDLALAIERHATSKLPDGSLDHIVTLGFRGEALPSIGSVGRLTITSRPRGAEGAHRIRVDAGRIEPLRPAAHGYGTKIEVEDLFHATPARLKFLKGDRAEAQAVAVVMRRLAIANPGIAVSLSGDHLTGFDFPAEQAGDEGEARRIGAILGAEFRTNAAPVMAERAAMRLRGLVSLPTWHRATASDQYLFVNGRPVRDKLLIGALKAAYADTIVAGRHAVVALFLELDPASVDVNVHPAKLEVRFRETEAVRSLIIGGIRDALAGAGHQASSRGGSGMLARMQASFATGRLNPDGVASPGSFPASFARGTAESSANAMGYSQEYSGHHQSYSGTVDASGRQIGARPLSFAFPDGIPERLETGFAEASPLAQQRDGLDAEQPLHPTDFPPLGYAQAQFHDTYILAQTADGIVIVDQHAAHERLVYERLKKARAGVGVARQPLLIPAVIEMDAASIARLAENAETIALSGLTIEPFGVGAMLVREVPAALIHADIGCLVRDLADSIAEWGGAEGLEARRDHVLKTIACHYSIRSGRRMKRDEMDALLRDMEATPGSGQCNHGRPTYISLKLGDLERLFGRS